jgi:hypothetical protein
MDDEFGALLIHAPTMSTQDLANVLGSSERIVVYARLLQLRATGMASSGQADAASRLAKQALELHLEDAIRDRGFGLDKNDVEQLIRLMRSLLLLPRYEAALRTLLPHRYG